MKAIAERPSIVEIITRYVALRRAGRELVGLCPFHAEKTPPFYVNADKEVFLCRGCGSGGDVIRFVELIERCEFKTALAHLGMAGQRLGHMSLKSPERRAAEVLATWAHEMGILIGARMRELVGRERLAGESSLTEAAEAYRIAWEVLEVLDDDLANPRFIPELWRERDFVEAVAHG